MSERGTCPACSVDLTPENSSRLRSGKVVHVGCQGSTQRERVDALIGALNAEGGGAVVHGALQAAMVAEANAADARSENRFSLPSAGPAKAEVPAHPPAESAPAVPPKRGRRMSIGVGAAPVVDVPDAALTVTRAVCPRCLGLELGVAASGPALAMHPGPFTPEVCEACSVAVFGPFPPVLAKLRDEKAAREAAKPKRDDFRVVGPRDIFAGVAEGARVAGEAWKSASAKMATAFEGVFPEILKPKGGIGSAAVQLHEVAPGVMAMRDRTPKEVEDDAFRAEARENQRTEERSRNARLYATDPEHRAEVDKAVTFEDRPKPVAGQRTPDAAAEARVKAESAARMRVPGPRAEADRRGLSAPPRPLSVRDLSDALQVPDETASAEPDDFEPPEHCSVCGKPKSKRLGLVLSTGTHLGCKAAQVRAQVREEVAELKAEKDGLKEDLAEKEAEVAELEEGIEAVTEHPEIGDLARHLIDDLPSSESALRRRDEQAALLKEPPPRHHFGGAPDGGVLDVSPPREPGELIHLFGLQEFGKYPFGKDRPERIQALCGAETEAKTRDLEPTVAKLGGVPEDPGDRNCQACVRNWTPEKLVFPAYVKPTQWVQSMGTGGPGKLPQVSPLPRTGSLARSPRAGR